jgi:putative Mg2+ transporter-C (MgtC) family protein
MAPFLFTQSPKTVPVHRHYFPPVSSSKTETPSDGETSMAVRHASGKEALPDFRSGVMAKRPGGTVSQSYIEEFQILLQAIIAMALGGLVGWEREASGKWAGFRTHMLVCVSATLFVRIGLLLIVDAQTRFAAPTLRTDPTRLIEAIAVGISFLGAGTIFRERGGARMKGLTTAASLLVVAPIGVAVAVDRYIIAVGVTLLTLFILRTLRRLEARVETKTTPEKAPGT